MTNITFRRLLDTTASAVTVIAGVYFLLLMISRPSGRQVAGIELPTAPVLIEAHKSQGNPSARVVAVEYADFECPFSAKMTKTVLPTLLSEYVAGGDVQWVFRHLPLPQHKSAFTAAVAAECADRQNRFWDVHDEIFADPKNVENAQLTVAAQRLGLDTKQFDACLHDESVNKAVLSEIDSARKMKLTSTPTVLVGLRGSDGRVKYVDSVEGAMPVAAFRAVLDKARQPRSSRVVVMGASAFVLVIGMIGWSIGRRRMKSLI